MKRIRCCGRFCFWRLPFGPWQCCVCDRHWPGRMPANAIPRFWEAVDELVARVEQLPPADPELLRLFYVRPPTEEDRRA